MYIPIHIHTEIHRCRYMYIYRYKYIYTDIDVYIITYTYCIEISRHRYIETCRDMSRYATVQSRCPKMPRKQNKHEHICCYSV